MAFVIPFIDVSGMMNRHQLNETTLIEWVPPFRLSFTNFRERTAFQFNTETIFIIIFLVGISVLITRLLIQFLSFRKMKKTATLISDTGVSIYQVDQKIIPFSFGNSIFINRLLHTEIELQDILRHEIVHVKQKHSIDIIFSEVICVINWFNPFAWLVRSAIRQNLEFIADKNVLEKGVDKKQYQYLLLKVTGYNQFSIAPKFNFSSLKKRIAMMNKLKSAKVNLLRFLFILPLLAIILLSFRKEISSSLKRTNHLFSQKQIVSNDSVPLVKKTSDKGFDIAIWKNKGNKSPIIIIKDKNENEVERLTMDEWNMKKEYFVNKYGQLPPPPPPAAPPAPPSPSRIPPPPPSKADNVAAISSTEKWPDNVLYVVNGTEVTKSVVENINPSVIESIDVLKGETAITKYGDKGKEGVLLIKTKATGELIPLYVIDGTTLTKEVAEKIDSKKIQSVNVLKGESAEKKYGEEGKNGVIEIRTKSADNPKPITTTYLFPAPIPKDGC